MTVENKEIQYSVGIEDLYLCLMKGNETSSALPTYEDIVYRQTNISDLTISTTSTNFTKWASKNLFRIYGIIYTKKDIFYDT